MIRAHLAAVEELLAAVTVNGQPIDVYRDRAEKYDEGGVELPLVYPYLVLWTGSGNQVDTGTLADADQSDLWDVLRVKAVAAHPDGVRQVQEKVREALLGKTPQVPGRACHPLRLIESRVPQDDPGVTLPGTQVHPAFGDDLYRLASTPA